MKVSITQKELLQILNEKFNSKVKITEISIRFNLENGGDDYVLFRENDWFLGMFAEKEIYKKLKNKGE